MIIIIISIIIVIIIVYISCITINIIIILMVIIDIFRFYYLLKPPDYSFCNKLSERWSWCRNGIYLELYTKGRDRNTYLRISNMKNMSFI